MKRLFTIGLWMLMFYALAPAQSRSVYVVNTLGKNVSWIDLDNGTVVKDAATAGLYANQIVLKGDRGYIVNSGDNEIQVIRLSDFTTLQRIDLGSGTNPYAMDFVNDSVAAVSLLLTNEVALVNVRNGAILSRITVGTGPQGVKYAAGKLYVANSGYNGQGYDPGTVSVIDVAQRTVIHTISVSINPQQIDADVQGFIYVVCTGNYADITGKLEIINGQADTVVKTIDMGTAVTNVFLNNNRAFISTYGYGVFIYDLVGDSLMNQTLPGGPAIGFDAQSNIYIADFNKDSVFVFAADFTPLSAYEVGDGPISLAVSDPAFTAIAEKHDRQLPEQFVLYQNYPNPFNPQTTIAFVTPTRAPVYLEVLNLLGQTVRVLVNGVLPAGNHQVVWDGRDAQLNPVPSGIYFYRLRIDGQSQVRKMHLLR
ncbi:MAG: T9SS type A sorting domain-containing protein [Calditrichaeota bacterium]|nr:T9SS type A sorting domain-containing protein [Calditrichota bacterium]